MKTISYRAFVIIIIMVASIIESSLHAQLKNSSELPGADRFDYLEYILVHVSKDHFFAGEHLMFSALVRNGKDNSQSDLSRILYVELLDRENRPLVQSKFYIENSVCNGLIEIPENMVTDNYVLRTYTSWMRNFTPHVFNHQLITIINPERGPRSVGFSDPKTQGIRFFPAGGHLVTGKKNLVYSIIANNTNCKIADTLAVINDVGDTISQIKPGFEKGLSFSIIPEENTTYGVRIADSLYALPPSSNDAIAIWLESQQGNFVFNIFSGHMRPAEETFNVFIHKNGIIYYHNLIQTSNHEGRILVKSEEIKPGISEILVFENGNCLAAHQFENVTDHLEIMPIAQNRMITKTRTKVNLSYKATPGSYLSVSVYLPETDSAAYQLIKAENIQSKPRYKQTVKGSRTENANGGFYNYHILSDLKKMEYFPEISHDIISGIIKNQGQKSKSQEIFMSILGEKTDIVKINTSENKNFHIAIPKFSTPEQMIFVSDSNEKISVNIQPEYDANFSRLNIPYTDIRSFSGENIKKGYISMQLKNIYQSSPEPKYADYHYEKFYGNADETIFLRDYIELPILEEFFRELLDYCIFTREKGMLKLNVLDKNTNRIIGKNPLILLDGVPLFETSDVLKLNPEVINAIHIKASKYIYGHLTFDGIIDIESNSRNGANADFSNAAGYLYIPPSKIRTEDMKTLINSENKKSIPDQRTLICWEPFQKISNDGLSDLSFYTSDIPGKYLIELVVTNSEGQIKTYHEVLEVR